MKRHPRQLLKRRKKRMARRPYATDHKPAFWFKRKTAEIRAAQMEQYRQKRPKPLLLVNGQTYQEIVLDDWGEVSKTNELRYIKAR